MVPFKVSQILLKLQHDSFEVETFVTKNVAT